MSKTPYELRAEVLESAKKYAMDSYYATQNVFDNAFKILTDNLTGSVSDPTEFVESLHKAANAINPFPTIDKILETATQFNCFVCDPGHYAGKGNLNAS